MFDHPDSPRGGRIGVAVATAAAAAALVTAPAVRADFTWTGAGDDELLTNDDNWLDGMAPDLDLSGDLLIFGPSAGEEQRPDVENLNYSDIGGLSFTGADAEYVIVGLAAAAFIFKDGAEIVNDSTFEQRIQIDIIGDGNRLILNAQDGDLVIDGDIFLVDPVGTTLEIIGDNDVRILERVLGFAGSLDMRGTGTLAMERSSSYSGGTRIFSGTVVLAAQSALGTGEVRINGDATIESDDNSRGLFNRVRIGDGVELTIGGNKDLSMSGEISGPGSLRIALQNLNDSLELTRANTFSGGVILESGTILLANGDGLGRAESLVLEGDGGLESRFDFIFTPIDIELNDNTLTLMGDNFLFFEGVISGTGGVTLDAETNSQDEEPIFTFEEDMLYTGITDILGGELRLLGSLAAGARVEGNGILSGTGEINGSVTNAEGGTVAPGDNLGTSGVGTLQVFGDYMQAEDATLAVDLNSELLTADLLDLSGEATLDENAVVTTSIVSQGYIPSNMLFTIIDADGGVTDDGVDVDFDSDTITVSVRIDPDFTNGDSEFVLELRRSGEAYSRPADTANNFAIGTGLDAMIPTADGDPSGDAGQLLGALDRLGEEDYNPAVNQLSPEPYNAVTSMNIDNVRSFTTQQASYFTSRRLGVEAWRGFNPLQVGVESLEDVSPWVLAATAAQQDDDNDAGPGVPPAEPWDPQWSTYVRFDGTFATVDSSSERTGYDAQAVGGQIGLDRQFGDDIIAGLAVGYTYTNADWDMSLGNLRDSAIRIGPYMTYTADKWFANVSLTFAYHFYSSERNIPLTLSTAEADYNGWEITAYGGGGYDFDLGKNFVLTPMASLQYSYFSYDSISESGGGAANLNVAGFNVDSLRSRLSAMLSYYADLGPKLQPYAYAGWEHEFLNQDDPLSSSFVIGGSPFSIRTVDLAKDRFFWGVGLSALFTYNVSAFVNFEQELASDFNVSFLSGGMSFVF